MKKYLLAPGPTPVPPEVLLGMARPMVHHRSPDFIPVMESARQGLKWLYQTENDVLILSCSGTGGMVGAVNNFFGPGDKALVINSGKFGERWTKICKAYGLGVKEIVVEWGYAVNPEDVKKALQEDPSIKGVFVQACETSTGVSHDVEALGAITKGKEGVLLVVDAISSLVAHDLKTDAWGLDIVIGGSQKGLMLPPGLAFLSASPKAWAANEKSTAPRFYFDLKKERDAIVKNQTCFTSSVTLIIGLNEAIGMLREEGLQNVFKRHAMLAKATRAAVQALGLSLYSKERPSNSVTAIEAPEGIDGQEIYKQLRERFGITGAGGQDQARGKIFRIAHLGHSGVFDVITAIAGIEMVLKSLGADITLGKGLAAAEQVFLGEAAK